MRNLKPRSTRIDTPSRPDMVRGSLGTSMPQLAPGPRAGHAARPRMRLYPICLKVPTREELAVGSRAARRVLDAASLASLMQLISMAQGGAPPPAHASELAGSHVDPHDSGHAQ